MMEFGVYRIVKSGRAGLVVDGRCNSGRISVGIEFKRVYSAIVEKSRLGYQDVGRTRLASVKLKVTRIEAYGRDLSEIETGLTARLHLAGSGADQVPDGSILGSE